MFRKGYAGLVLKLVMVAAVCMMVLPVNTWAMKCQVKPDTVRINAWYHGEKLTVTGDITQGSNVIVTLTSPPTTAHFKYKGKAAGLFWMKIGDMDFEPVPSVYLVYTSGKLSDIIAEQEQATYHIGFEALKRNVEIKGPKDIDKDKWFNEFIKIKKQENLYGVREGVVSIRDDQGHKTFEVQLDWPYKAAPGEYTVQAIAVEDGKVVDTATTSFTVARTGLVKTLSTLAFEKPALYGVMAVIIAMVVGFAVGLVFKGGGSH